MSWHDKLTPKEAAELDRAKRKRAKAEAEWQAVRLKLKNRAESRIRTERARNG